MAEDLVVGFTTTESLKRCFSQVGFFCFNLKEVKMFSG